MSFDICHSVMLRLLHVLLWIRVYIWTYVSRNLHKISFIFSSLFEFQRKRMGERCRADSKMLPKLPLHVGLQILEKQHSEKDVARLLVWCMALGIPYLTLFDIQGYFKKNSTSLNNRIQEAITELCTGSNLPVFQIEAPRRNGEISWEILHKANSEASDKTRIALISSQDGRQDIVDSARKICQNVSDKQCKTSDIDIAHLDELINTCTSMVFPDPELIIQFGTLESLLGFSPWKIRVTEIMSLPSHHSVDYHSFLSVLQSFSTTKQRFGK